MKVYQYALFAPRENEDRVRSQMRAAHEYRNKLVELERARRAAVRAAMKTPDVEAAEEILSAAKARYEQASLAVRSARKATQSRSDTVEMRDAVTAARLVLRSARIALGAARKAALRVESVSAAVSAIDETASEDLRNARAECGVYWGTYLLIESAHQAARKAPLWADDEPNDPHFVRFVGEGHVSVQCQGGLDTQKALSGRDTRLCIEAIPEAMFLRETRRAERKFLTTLRIRIGSDARDPVWASFPMVMHRPLPRGAIKVATVSLRRVGPVEKWSIELTIDEALPAWAGDMSSPKVKADSVVGVDLGWRVVPQGALRVARWVGSDGASGELLLSAETLRRLRLPDELRSQREHRFQMARMALVQFAAARSDLPEALKAATETLAQWRSPARLAKLAELWAEHRFPGDEIGYSALRAWAASDWHAWRAETRERQWSLRHRRELYRVFAHELAGKYAHIALENTRFDRLARRPAADDTDAVNETARSNRFLAASGELRLTLANRFGKERTLVVDTSHSTDTCHACGVVAAFDGAEHLERVCPSCGAVWDQDDNAAIIHCRLGEEALRQRAAPQDKKDPLLAPGGRWAKAKAQKAAKRSGAAPETLP